MDKHTYKPLFRNGVDRPELTDFDDEQYSYVQGPLCMIYDYWYCDSKGNLFHTHKPTLEECEALRDKWLERPLAERTKKFSLAAWQRRWRKGAEIEKNFHAMLESLRIDND